MTTRRPYLSVLMALSLTVILSSCKTMASGGTDVCAVWRPVSWSVKDTLPTIDDVKGNNARRGAWCK